MLASLDGLLRGRVETVSRIVVILLLCGAFYGAAMGSFWGDHSVRPLQMLYSSLKVPLLVGITFALSVPTYFVMSTLMGLREDFGASIRALMTTQAVLSIVLGSFAPFTLLFYASSNNYSGALMFNALMFGLASYFAQRVLAAQFKPLIARNPRHLAMMRVWLVIYAFIGIQMAWVLRPFVGNPDDPTTFFREGAWGNAYEAVAGHLGRALGL